MVAVRVIKVDVGGSHSIECELLGGQEYRLNLETTHGLNPFALARGVNGQGTYGGAEVTESVRSIMSTFIESLVLEEGETRIPKDVKIEIDEMLQYCFNSKDQPTTPLSIDQLLKFQFSRSKLLSRWGSKGLFGKVFREAPDLKSSRLIYFNFQDIFQASDQDFSQGVMAAVLAVFNLEMRNHPNSRIILICDETPFFIEKCFSLFKLSTANVRKFGGSVILVAQASKHLVVGGDTGILDNSHHKILFSADGNLREFQERMRLRAKDLDLLTKLTFQSGKFSEFLYQEGDHARAMRLILTPEEYWRITSNPTDRQKLKNLMSAVPGLKLDEAISCLSVGRF